MKRRIQHIHFVGIGGAGMSGIAEVLLNLGYTISGSDMQTSSATQRLQQLGARIAIGHDAAHIADAGVLVVSTAVAPENPEVQAARAAQIPVVPRALMLAELMRMKRGIAVAGTHGKTTTTSLTASVLAAGGLDPTFVIGGKLTAMQTNARLGQGEYIVVEADESDASFLNLLPVTAVITNIDADHLQTYGHDLQRLKDAFIEFVHRLPFYGNVIVCLDDMHVREILPALSRPVITYGLDEAATFRATNLRAQGTRMHFDLVQRSGKRTLPPRPLCVNLPGQHNVLNALAAIAVAHDVGLWGGDEKADEKTQAAMEQALQTFNGVGRRFTVVGELACAGGRKQGRFTVVDDYAHHPSEMRATLVAARAAWPGQRIVLAFEPHRYTRTRDCFEDFVDVLGAADVVLLTEVFAAGEAPLVAADGRALARALRVAGKVEPVFVERVDALPDTILDMARDGDIVLIMGAGSISKVAGWLQNNAGNTSGDPT